MFARGICAKRDEESDRIGKISLDASRAEYELCCVSKLLAGHGCTDEAGAEGYLEATDVAKYTKTIDEAEAEFQKADDDAFVLTGEITHSVWRCRVREMWPRRRLEFRADCARLRARVTAGAVAEKGTT